MKLLVTIASIHDYSGFGETICVPWNDLHSIVYLSTCTFGLAGLPMQIQYQRAKWH
jgi:hypothetical protein